MTDMTENAQPGGPGDICEVQNSSTTSCITAGIKPQDKPDNSNRTLQAALELARAGYPVFPCAQDKAPLVKWKEAATTDEATIRRFLIHVLPKGQHRIRHYGLFANGNRAANIARIRQLLATCTPAPDTPAADTDAADTVEGPRVLALPCPCCGGRLIIVDAFGPGGPSHHRPAPEAIDSS